MMKKRLMGGYENSKNGLGEEVKMYKRRKGRD